MTYSKIDKFLLFTTNFRLINLVLRWLNKRNAKNNFLLCQKNHIISIVNVLRLFNTFLLFVKTIKK